MMGGVGHRFKPPVKSFTCRNARSLPIVIALIGVTVVEGGVVTILVANSYPIVAWALIALNVSGIVWFVADYRAMGIGGVEVTDDAVRMRIGRRWQLDVPRSSVALVLQPTFRDLPTPGTVDADDYANFTKPASANVLIVLEQPMKARGPGGVRKTVRRIGLHLDEPAAFVAIFGKTS